MASVRLVVQADDLGMCRAVNEGITLAATEGIVTQASVMAPTSPEVRRVIERRGIELVSLPFP